LDSNFINPAPLESGGLNGELSETMPRGSKPGERRGGRQRATPNKRTVLKERIVSIASAYPAASDDEIVDYLTKDPMLPASLRHVVARKWHADAGLRSLILRSRKRSPKMPKALEATVSTNANPTTSEVASRKVSATDTDSSVGGAVLPVLFGIVRDRAAEPTEQHSAALALAQYFLPKKSFVKKPRQEFVADECGFVIEPNVARELRDLKLELDHLPLSSKKRSPHIVARKSAQLQKRIQEIQQSLACPCPSKYRLRRTFRTDPQASSSRRERLPGTRLESPAFACGARKKRFSRRRKISKKQFGWRDTIALCMDMK
jgi:hypothetical protein